MDTTDSDIIFNQSGICNHCITAEKLLKSEPYSLKAKEKEMKLRELISEIKESGKGKKYDCIIGLSGGVDSSFVAYKIVRLGLRPLAVHLDNGWDSELAVKNIENIVKKLDIDLYTYVIDWEEFKDLQLAFLKSSTPDSEIPTDHAIISILYKKAKKENIKYILAGSNLSTESIMPPLWSHGHYDWKYINNVNKKFGNKPLKTFPHFSIFEWYFNKKILKKVKWINILDYIDYVKKDAIQILENELNWKKYGEKHYESIYTRFFQGYILPNKFGFDKRKAHLSGLIISGQLSREEALNELKKEPYPNPELLEEDKEYFLNKFGMTNDEFNSFMSTPLKNFHDYPSYENSLLWNLLLRIFSTKNKRR